MAWWIFGACGFLAIPAFFLYMQMQESPLASMSPMNIPPKAFLIYPPLAAVVWLISLGLGALCFWVGSRLDVKSRHMRVAWEKEQQEKIDR